VPGTTAVDGRPAASPHWVRPLTPKQFARFQALVHREAGIHLSEAKRALLVGRLLRRLRVTGLDSFDAYCDLVEADPQERVLMLDCICTNETHFFRDARQFAYLEQRACDQWERAAAAGRRSRVLRVWSAGCSTGEEPYSVAMSLRARLPREWELQVLGTDLSTRALERARTAVWPIERAEEIPAALLRRFMLRGVGPQEGRMRACPELQTLVRIDRLNLNDERYAVAGPFDLILCRNVLIYFDQAGKRRVIERLVDHLAPGGLLLLGNAESLSGITSRTRGVGPAVYVRLEDSPGSRAAPAAGRPHPGR
jgi:chemotaxis protein methyltransferase CheR